MIYRNILGNLSNFYFTAKKNFRNFYLKSNLYDKKISDVNDNNFEYKPSPHLLSSIVKYQKKKYKIDDFALDSIWKNNINIRDYKKLNNFFLVF
tara:strand:+ start:39 stop:320 length:282 start_codon:yes stop_codon:yes gene_type:complete